MVAADLLSRFGGLLLGGLLITVAVSAAGLALAVMLAAPMAAMKLSRPGLVRLAGTGLVEVLRNAPFIVLLFLVHFGMQRLVGRLPAWTTGVVALAMYGSAYFAEVLRAAYLAVPSGQREAARTLGLSAGQAVRLVIAPQMLGAVLPPARVVAVMLLKESAVLSVIAIPELTHACLRIQAETFETVPVFLLLGALYWLLTGALSAAGHGLERASRGEHEGLARQSEVAVRYLVLDWRPRAR